MKKIIVTTAVGLLAGATVLISLQSCFQSQAKDLAYLYVLSSGDTLKVDQLGDNSFRVRIAPPGSHEYKNYFYLEQPKEPARRSNANFAFDRKTEKLSFYDNFGNLVLEEDAHNLTKSQDMGVDTWIVSQSFKTPEDDHQFGLGQHQDGNLEVTGQTKRLTQLNSQISMPVVISNKRYGILWNNNGLTEFNPTDQSLELTPVEDVNARTVDVNATSTTGNVVDRRTDQVFVGDLVIEQAGRYGLMMDAGKTMTAKLHVKVDGQDAFYANNVWLPPTASFIMDLDKGSHKVEFLGVKGDNPRLSYRPIDQTTTFTSPVSQGIDYTVFVGDPDVVIAEIRRLTGEVPMLPKWALGYVHCRERYFSQDDLLANATEFRNRNIPIDVIVQDWQWWGRNGWNAMVFDSETYPDPKAMMDSLHAMDMRGMLSVWAKVDRNSDFGKVMAQEGHYIPDTEWVDFFSDEAAEAYWNKYRENLVSTGMDSWWQDATEPENDDLRDRRINRDSSSGNIYRNVFPIVVNDRVYKGLRQERPNERPLILTRSAAPGIQRYGVFNWSGDVGNDYNTLKTQIAGGLGLMATGQPWWTYDAGGFFRPGDQYVNEEYQKRMLRWIQNSVFLPMMRVHGYMSRTEPWHYSPQTYDNFVGSIRLRYSLLPYLYTEAVKVTKDNGTMMRPLVFDFKDDSVALEQSTEYMLGKNMLVCPVVEDVQSMDVYLPDNKKGWYHLFTNEYYDGGESYNVALTEDHIPVFAPAGSIIPMSDIDDNLRSVKDLDNYPIILKIYPGQDATYELYDDDGYSEEYISGAWSAIPIKWEESSRTLTLDKVKGDYPSFAKEFVVELADGTRKNLSYKGDKVQVKL